VVKPQELKMKKNVFLFVVVCLGLLSGCATTSTQTYCDNHNRISANTVKAADSANYIGQSGNADDIELKRLVKRSALAVQTGSTLGAEKNCFDAY
jgi:uncharacterized protein YceK